MIVRRWARQRGVRGLGVSLLILSLVHTPLPQPDFHNIRHHDAPGEVCGYHDHLLRWHPGAGSAEDVAVLHWHWFIPGSEGADLPARGGGPAVHAHAPDWPVSTWDDGPRIAPDTSSCWLVRPAPSPLSPACLPAEALGFAALHRFETPTPLSFSATFAPGISVAALLQRWSC